MSIQRYRTPPGAEDRMLADEAGVWVKWEDLPDGGVLVKALIERAKEIGLLSIEDVREVAATLSLPDGGVAVSDAMVERGWRGLDEFNRRLYVNKEDVRVILEAALSSEAKTGERS